MEAEKGKFIVIRAIDETLGDCADWVIHYVNDEFPIEEVNKFIHLGEIQIREATQREKKLCYLASEFMNQNNGIYVKQLDAIENLLNTPEADCESSENL